MASRKISIFQSFISRNLFWKATSINTVKHDEAVVDHNKPATREQHVNLITEKGKKLSIFLDHMDVEHLWLPGKHINWKTGEVNSPLKSSTHCSAFVAAVAYRLGIYILRPPEHSLILLANAQYSWLEKEGVHYGWKKIDHCLDAQNLANKGFLVVASYQNPNPKKPGHTAIVRPYEKSIEALQKEGCQIIQAGTKNYNSTTLKRGFAYHPLAWKNHMIIFFVHALDEIEW